MSVTRTELATLATAKLRELGLKARNFGIRIRYQESILNYNNTWKVLLIRDVAEDTAFDLTENQIEQLLSALNNTGTVSISTFLNP